MHASPSRQLLFIYLFFFFISIQLKINRSLLYTRTFKGLSLLRIEEIWSVCHFWLNRATYACDSIPPRQKHAAIDPGGSLIHTSSFGNNKCRSNWILMDKFEFILYWNWMEVVVAAERTEKNPWAKNKTQQENSKNSDNHKLFSPPPPPTWSSLSLSTLPISSQNDTNEMEKKRETYEHENIRNRCICTAQHFCFSVWWLLLSHFFFISLRKAYRHAHYNTHFLMHKLFGGHWYGCVRSTLTILLARFVSLALCVCFILYSWAVRSSHSEKLTHEKRAIYAWIALIILIMDLNTVCKERN